MCEHPRCGNRTRFVLKGSPYGEVRLCNYHKEFYIKSNPNMKVTDLDEVLEGLGKKK